MARLRDEEDARAYERMTRPSPGAAKFAQASSQFSPAGPLGSDAELLMHEDDETTYADVNRQMTLIINVLLSIVTCSIAIWLVARQWSVPLRLCLSMAGSGLVGIAEVVIYTGYLRRIKAAKNEERKRPEVRKIVHSWISELGKSDIVDCDSAPFRDRDSVDGVRHRTHKSRMAS